MERFVEVLAFKDSHSITAEILKEFEDFSNF